MDIQEMIDIFIQWLPVFIPVALIIIGLQVFVIVDIIRKKQTKTLSPVVWVLIAIAVDVIGPVLYIIFGRSDTVGSDEDF